MRVEHLALYVDDLEDARRFFETWFQGKSNAGYHNPASGFRSYFIEFDGGARVELMSHPEQNTDVCLQKRTGYDHVAFSLGSREEVDRLSVELQNSGYPLLSGPRTTGDGYYESCILYGNSIRIELTI